VSISGHGYGHGIGMSQYGAEGAARQGLSYSQILAHYYPGTALSTKTGDIRVLISGQTSDNTEVAGQSGLELYEISAKRRTALPTKVDGKTVTGWRMVPYVSGSSRSKLQVKTDGGYRNFYDSGSRLPNWYNDAQISSSSTVKLTVSGGSMVVRGAVRATSVASQGARDTVNVLSIEDYVRGVIAAEMPSSWSSEALKAQAVAARSYGARSIGSHSSYDICSTTACQVYKGASSETSNTDAAVKGTAGKVLTYKGSVAVTQFSSSSGGYTASSASVGTYPYLKAVNDPYDNWSGNANHSWKVTVTASKIEQAYPTIGTLQKMTITKRSGNGDFGGRVTSLVLTGSKKSVTISGDDARWAFGMKSNWFAF
jgi:SpoIID/LytB domain protein